MLVWHNGTTLIKVGSYDGHLTNRSAYADDSLIDVVYAASNPEYTTVCLRFEARIGGRDTETVGHPAAGHIQITMTCQIVWNSWSGSRGFENTHVRSQPWPITALLLILSALPFVSVAHGQSPETVARAIRSPARPPTISRNCGPAPSPISLVSP
jgi:hypothetical protein